MKHSMCVALVALLPVAAMAAEFPDWAYPVTKPRGPADNVVLKQMPGSPRQYTEAQIGDGFSPPDWYPDEHPPLPEIVAHGSKPGVRACILCHLTSGSGHPESSPVAGFPLAYILRQMDDFKSGARKGGRAAAMNEIANAISDADLHAAAAYFAALKPVVWTKVVETDTVPKTHLEGAMRFATPEGGTEPIGQRIITLPQDPEGARSRNPHTGFVALVPPGSIAKGEQLVANGGAGKTIPCAICHGPALKGLGHLPGIVGLAPIYTVRQLRDMQIGDRTGPMVELMKGVVAQLDIDDMIAIAAYLGSREP
jgi:cytochrome c553